MVRRRWRKVLLSPPVSPPMKLPDISLPSDLNPLNLRMVTSSKCIYLLNKKKSHFSLSDLGVHIDGFIAQVAHTLVVGGKPVEGRKADVILAAYNAIQGALRTIKPGNTNYDVSHIYR